MVVCARWVGEPEGWAGPVLSAPVGVTGRVGALGRVSSTISPPSLLAPLRLPPLLRQACRPRSRCARSASLAGPTRRSLFTGALAVPSPGLASLLWGLGVS